MPAVDFTNLDKAMTDLAAAADTEVTTDDGAAVVIQGIGAQILTAVTAALDARGTATQGTIDTVTASVNATVARMVASSGKLGAAIANVPTSGAPAPNVP